MDGAGDRVTTRLLLADQLGPHFLPAADEAQMPEVLLVESRAAFSRRRVHRAKAHVLLSALRHRARESPGRVTLIEAPSLRSVLREWRGPLIASAPTSRSTRALLSEYDVTMEPARGFVTTQAEFAEWAQGRGRRRLVMEDFYRDVRRRTGILMEGDEPIGGRWNFDADNRCPPPRGQSTLGLPEPWWPVEDDIDEQVRADLDQWSRDGIHLVGSDGPRRFAATREEAVAALEDFAEHRLPLFGPYEDAALSQDWVMAHSLISVPMNLGLLDPREVIERVVRAYVDGSAPLSSVEGFVRQVLGWRDYVWHLYWHLGPDYLSSNTLAANTPLPDWFHSLDADKTVRARCLSTALAEVQEHAWTHHIMRLMILGNWALQHGFDPQETTRWFTDSFADGHEWVMAANVVGMALHADGGVMATKPYAGGGAYIKRMTDLCSGCEYRPQIRVGDKACPFTAGYWAFLDKHRERFERHPRMAQAVRGLERLNDREAMIAQERGRGNGAP